ncbi:hypothetical protein BB934_45855 (plasmid) [Microvirga ossetica]|uniref:Uncharacterized protein n=1 Tax=Microvirga ossetica TaxID=1882682 RepID=A0A1B2EZX6_9HYPH|nr:hypothetical protein [Microvirga ossetica]ANY85545.1 hypothetical protein BB934_45855 [Microvirga ossetica]
MSKSRTLIIAAVLIPSLGSPVPAYVYPGRPNCPWSNPANAWAKYINQEYGDKEPFFSIRFTRDIGDIQANECYTITYFGNKNWGGAGKIRNQNNAKNERRNGADPTQYQINVWGATFTYNEAGEVFYTPDGQLAGNMYCHIGTECWK